ncbi:MAG: EF-hand domain-containing protein [Sphingomonas sp.]|nr:EF-hand domain-containing protein [Sphingomonas sp.]
MTKYLLGGALAAAMVGIAPAIAQVPQAAPAPIIERMHVAKTHARADVGTHVRTMFERFDTNRDGFITKAETEAAKAKRGEHIVRRRGAGSPGAPQANRGVMFDRIDANRDGSISRAEFEAAPKRQERRIAIRTDGDKAGGAHGMGMMRGMRMGMGGLGGRMFEEADANRDGKVSLQEATASAYRHFDMADANRDGQITREERMQMHQRMRSERKPG